MELAGHKCVGFCEWDKYAAASYISMHLITDEQRKYLATLNLKKRQKEILGDEYRNGEWYSDDIRNVDAGSMPQADCWCFGAPCQDFSIAGKRAGLNGDRSSLIREVFRILGEIREEDRPEWLIYENVKGMLSSNGGFDFLTILLAMDELGYDIEWQLFNSKDWGVPQNRERVYTVGHLRTRGSRKIFPVRESNEIYHRTRENREKADEVALCLTAKGNANWTGNFVSIPISMTRRAIKESNIANTLTARTPDKKRENYSPVPGVALKVKEATKKGYAIAHEGDSINLDRPGSRTRRGRVGRQIANTLDTSCDQGIFVQVSDELTAYAIWYEKYQCYIAIRKLTPKECFRLQGWEDIYFERAAFVNSDSQLYKQAGNGVTVSVVYVIGKAIAELEEV